jgi:hypothetical protein
MGERERDMEQALVELQARIAAMHLIMTLLGQIALKIDRDAVEQRLRATRMMLQAGENGRIPGVDAMTLRSLEIQIDLLQHILGSDDDDSPSAANAD